MAVTTTESNNKLLQYTKDINRETIRENMFSPYMGAGMTAIIRQRYELKSGGEQMNIPLVTRLTGSGVGSGTLVGNEEKIDNYGMRVWLAWSRHAVVTNKSEKQKDSADIFGESKPLLSDWQKEKLRDEVISALMALPSESQPATDVCVNGIQYDLASATQRNTWQTNNSDRILYGAATGNLKSTHALSLAELDTSADTFTSTNLSNLKAVAKLATPKLRPCRTEDGYEQFVCFAGTNTFRALKADLKASNTDARPRSTQNVIFQDGDLLWDGIIVREVPEISSFVTNVWTSLLTAGNGGTTRVEPVFFCGQQAAVIAYGQMVQPTFREEKDYGFISGTGIDSAYGVAKMFKKHPNDGSALKQWGVATGFFAVTTV